MEIRLDEDWVKWREGGSDVLGTHARRELCSRLCRYEGASITDVDVERLNDARRPWEVVIAGRQLPHLARLRGFGFVVDVQRVREARLDTNDGPLGGVALRSCIGGEGDPPRELLLAAVACSASGRVRGVPVQRLREDGAIGSLDLDSSRLGVIGAELLGLMLPAATSVRSLRCPSAMPATLPPPNPGLYSTMPFLSVPIDTPPSLGSLAYNQLCGLDDIGRGTYTAEGINKLREGLKGSAVTSLKCAAPECSLLVSAPIDTAHPPTSEPHLCMNLCSLALNQLGPEGGAAIAEGLKGNSTLQSLE